MQRLTQLSVPAMVMLVLLRVSIGWHYFKEGTKKYKDPGFTSAVFLRQATGPLAHLYHDTAGEEAYGWDRTMAIPRKDAPGETADAAPADADPDAIPDSAPYKSWAEDVIYSWKKRLQTASDAARYDEPQREAVAKVYEKRIAQLKDYLADKSGDLLDYQHELYRLGQMEADDTAEEVPYQQARIQQKRAELQATAAGIQYDVKQFEDGLINDVLSQLSGEQQDRVTAALANTKVARIDRYVTFLHIGIGVCLIVGLLTRLSAFLSALFLLSVVLSQPFWVPDAATTYYQWVELFASLVLATTHAGKWGGLDYFLNSMCQACCGGSGDA
ncbi:MAG: DoxX family protein [Planctomycetales bacterium]|nr:DoxX family protein [Planctomycetales bacterium]